MTVIGITGRMGSGKRTTAAYLHERHGFPALSVSSFVLDVAETEGLAPTRTNLHDISERYAVEYGADFFVRRLLDTHSEVSGGTFVLSGIRTRADVDMLRDLYGDELLLAAVETEAATTRFDRLRRRGLPQDPETYQEFLRVDAEEDDLFDFDETIAAADEVLHNDGSLQELYRQIDAKVLLRFLAEKDEERHRA